MTDNELLAELASFPYHQQVWTRKIWELSESMRVCWVCGDEAAELQSNDVRGYSCFDCFAIQKTLSDSFIP